MQHKTVHELQSCAFHCSLEEVSICFILLGYLWYGGGGGLILLINFFLQVSWWLGSLALSQRTFNNQLKRDQCSSYVASCQMMVYDDGHGNCRRFLKFLRLGNQISKVKKILLRKKTTKTSTICYVWSMVSTCILKENLVKNVDNITKMVAFITLCASVYVCIGVQLNFCHHNACVNDL